MIETISQKVKRDYLENNFPSTKIVDVTTGKEDESVVICPFEDIDKVSPSLFPVGSFMKGDELYGIFRDKIVHTLLIGNTGTGKTTGALINNVIMTCKKSNSPSIIVNDTGGGESIKAIIRTVKKLGKYKIKVLNVSDPERSDRYSHIDSILQETLQIKKLKMPLYKNNLIETHIEKFVNILQPIESEKDPIWDQGANDMMKGLLWDMVEDLYDGKIPPETFNLYNLVNRYFWLRDEVNSKYITRIEDIARYRNKPENAMSVRKINAVCCNNEKTRSSYFGVVENHNAAICNFITYLLCSDSTISVEEFVNEPTIIFINSGGSPAGETIVSFLINDIYYYVEEKRKKQLWSNEKGRDIHLFIDEFANYKIAEGDTFKKMLSESRKYGMYFHIFLQSDSQLITKYDENISNSIKDNCTLFFMGSEEYKTLRSFSDIVGKKTVEEYGSLLSNKMSNFVVVDALPPEKLRMLPMYHCYIVQKDKPVLYSRYEPYYKCENIIDVETDYDAVYPVNDVDYEATYFDLKTNRKSGVKHQSSLSGIRSYEDTVDEIRNYFDEMVEEVDLGREDEECLYHQDDYELDDYTSKDNVKTGNRYIGFLTDSEIEELYLNDEGCVGEEIEFKTVEELNILTPNILENCEKYGIVFIKKDKLEQIIDDEFARWGRMAKYEVSETFFGKNSFTDMTKWKNGFSKAVKKLNRILHLSDLAKEVFADVAGMIEEMDMDQVETLKKILSSDYED